MATTVVRERTCPECNTFIPHTDSRCPKCDAVSPWAISDKAETHTSPLHEITWKGAFKIGIAVALAFVVKDGVDDLARLFYLAVNG